MFFSLPDPDPAVCTKNKFESGSFYHQSKIVRNTLIPPLLFCDFFMSFYL
jgi:hypothetical protein